MSVWVCSQIVAVERSPKCLWASGWCLGSARGPLGTALQAWTLPVGHGWGSVRWALGAAQQSGKHAPSPCPHCTGGQPGPSCLTSHLLQRKRQMPRAVCSLGLSGAPGGCELAVRLDYPVQQASPVPFFPWLPVGPAAGTWLLQGGTAPWA